MRARVPLDVDFEDKLLYGLTPIRLAYLVVALLCGFALWSSRWAPSPVRAVTCLFAVGLGAVFAWGRWRARPADGWLADVAIFVTNSYRLTWDKHWARRLIHRPFRTHTVAEPNAPPAIVIGTR